MTQKQLDDRDWKAILRARTKVDGTPKPGYRRNVEAIRQQMASEKDHGFIGGGTAN